MRLAIYDLKPIDHANAAVTEELRRRAAGEPSVMPTDRYLPATLISATRSLRSGGERMPAGRAQWETMLDLLATRGLVDELRGEGEVERGLPQAYRWSRRATDDALRRFIGGPKRTVACATEECDGLVSQRHRLCSPCERKNRVGHAKHEPRRAS